MAFSHDTIERKTGLLIALVIRTFLFQPFNIPSGSLIPTLLVGDLILVNKFHYGIRLPVINRKIIANHDPQRGDVIVFRYPLDTRIDYIKRVVGLPGDEVAYLNQQLTVNGKLTMLSSTGAGPLINKIAVSPSRISMLIGVGATDTLIPAGTAPSDSTAV